MMGVRKIKKLQHRIAPAAGSLEERSLREPEPLFRRSLGVDPARPRRGREPHNAHDQIGALNRILEEKVIEASGIVKQGKAIRMGIEGQKETPSLSPRIWSVHTFLPSPEGGRSYGVKKFNHIDSVVMGCNGTGPQIDALAPGGVDNMFYKCTPVEELLKADGVTKFGAETQPAIVTLGVIPYMVGLTGENPVPEGTVFNRAEIDAAMERQNVEIGKGDVVIFYTGLTYLIGEDDERSSAGEAGIGIEGARYLAELGVAMVGADTWALDALPFEGHLR